MFADIDPVTLNLDPDAAAAAVTERTTRAAAGPHLRLPGRPAGVRARSGLPIVEDACEALGAVHADGVAGRRAAATRRSSASTPTSSSRRARAGWSRSATPAMKERIDSERNQGRAPDMGWLDHDRLGFNYRLSDIACALGLAQLERLDEHARRPRARRRAATARRSPASRASTLPCPDARRRRARLVRLRRPAPARRRPRRRSSRALRERGIQSKPYLPAIHLMSFYRERFGHREGEFPVCEDVAARSLALPFFPAMTRGRRSTRVARRAARRSLGRSSAHRLRRPMSRFHEPQDPRLPAAQRLDRLRLAAVAATTSTSRGRTRAMLAAQRDHRRRGPRRAARRPRRGRARAGATGRFPFAPDDEDIHMAIERRLTEIAGPVGGQAAHRALAQRPGRHRRRDVHARRRAAPRRSASARLMARAARRRRAPPRLADARLHPPAARPAGLPRPPPARLLLDARPRPRALPLRRRRRPRALPLGAGALAGRELRHRPRRGRRRRSASTRVAPNSIDAVSNRDFVLDYLGAAATCATHLSRLGAEIVLWSSEEFGFVELPDAWSSGSSIMPQKKNPDAAELLRAKAPRIVGHLAALHGVHARAAADLQQGHAGGQGAPLRRGRHARARASTRRRGMLERRRASTASAWPRRPPTSCSPRPTSPTCSCAAACRSARRTASSPASSATRSTAAARSPS